jgi:hypothetical protein
MTRSISKDGPPELGEPAFPMQMLVRWNGLYVERLRGAITAGLERAVEGVDRRPGTKRPRTFDPARGVLP